MYKYLLIVIGFVLCRNASAQCPVDFQYVLNGMEVTFNPTNPNVDSSFWDFGDGATEISTQAAVAHTYSTPGTYTVCLGTTGVGCTDTICHTVIVCGFTAGFTATVNGSIAEFVNLSTGNFGLVVWDFGDGFTSNDSTANNAYHAYGAPGTYSVCVSVATASNECLTPYCEDITVLGGGLCVDSSQIDLNFICPENTEPVCGCNGWTYDNPCDAYHHGVTSYTPGVCPNCDAGFTPSANGLVVTFANTSLGNNVSYTWDFGDGNTSTDSDPVHSYAANGTYIVCLSISNAFICNDLYCDTITVSNSIQCDAKYDLAGSCDSAVFINTSTGNYQQSAWNINTVPTMNTDTMVLTTPGTYVVCFTIQGDSCFDTQCDTFKVHAPDAFQPGFAASFTPGSLPLTVGFEGTDTADYATSFSWDFDDGGSADVQNPTHVFDRCAINVCMTVSDAFGCSETFCDSLYLCDVSVNNVSSNAGFGLYPNPGKDFCYIVAKQNHTGNASLVITDVTGRVVNERTVSNLQQGKLISVNTSSFAQGCYFFNLISEKQTASLRWIKE